MFKWFRSSGIHFILATGLLYLMLSVVAMSTVISGYKPDNMDSVDRVFWTAIMLAFGTPAVVIFQICGNMYVAKPVSDIRAGLLALTSGAITLLVLKYFVGASFGA